MARFSQTPAYQPAADSLYRRPELPMQEKEDFSELLQGGQELPSDAWRMPEEETPLADERDFDQSFEQQGAWYDDAEDDSEDDYFTDDLFTEEDQAELRRERWQTLAHLGDFLGVIAGTAAVLVLIALLISLLNWLQADVVQTFSLLQTNL